MLRCHRETSQHGKVNSANVITGWQKSKTDVWIPCTEELNAEVWMGIHKRRVFPTLPRLCSALWSAASAWAMAAWRPLGKMKPRRVLWCCTWYFINTEEACTVSAVKLYEMIQDCLIYRICLDIKPLTEQFFQTLAGVGAFMTSTL